MALRLAEFLTELKRRKVYRVAAVYAVSGLGILGAAEVILDPLGLGWFRKYLVILVLVGFPIALVLGWAFDLRLETPRSGPETGGDSGSARARRKSIVVLPFDNMSPEPADAYLADGLTEEIITDLSRLLSLRVISRSSAMVFKGTEKDVRTIGKELDVQFLLEGSVRKSGDDLRITAQLIDAGSDEHLWAEKYDGALDDVFRMQEDVARSIVEQLAVRISPEEDRRLSARPIHDVSAYQCYLRARQLVWDGNPEGLDRAVHDLETALNLVGKNALILAGLGYVFFQKANFGIEQEDAIEKALRYAQQALELDPDCAEVEVVLGVSQGSFLGDMRTGRKHLLRARQLDPSNADAMAWLVVIHLTFGQMEEARVLADSLVALDPLNSFTHSAKADFHLFTGEFGLAVESAGQAYEMAPESTVLIAFLAWALAFAGRIDEFEHVRERGLPDDSSGMARFALLFEAAGKRDREGVLGLISDDLELTCQRDPWWSYFLSSILAGVGEKDRAIEWLERAIKLGFINYPYLNQIDPFLANLRDEARFRSLMRQAEQEWRTRGR